MVAAAALGFAGLLLHAFTTWRLSVREPPAPVCGTKVDVVVRTRDEPASRVRRTLPAALAMPRPAELGPRAGVTQPADPGPALTGQPATLRASG